MSTHLESPAKSQMATLKIRRGKVGRIAGLSTLIAEDDEWLTVEYPFHLQAELLSDLLWHLDDLELMQPESARAALISALEEIAGEHV
jgi:predicted DNA-binding transcriptional regulator YafY